MSTFKHKKRTFGHEARGQLVSNGHLLILVIAEELDDSVYLRGRERDDGATECSRSHIRHQRHFEEKNDKVNTTESGQLRAPLCLVKYSYRLVNFMGFFFHPVRPISNGDDEYACALSVVSRVMQAEHGPIPSTYTCS